MKLGFGANKSIEKQLRARSLFVDAVQLARLTVTDTGI